MTIEALIPERRTGAAPPGAPVAYAAMIGIAPPVAESTVRSPAALPPSTRGTARLPLERLRSRRGMLVMTSTSLLVAMLLAALARLHYAHAAQLPAPDLELDRRRERAAIEAAAMLTALPPAPPVLPAPVPAPVEPAPASAPPPPPPSPSPSPSPPSALPAPFSAIEPPAAARRFRAMASAPLPAPIPDLIEGEAMPRPGTDALAGVQIEGSLRLADPAGAPFKVGRIRAGARPQAELVAIDADGNPSGGWHEVGAALAGGWVVLQIGPEFVDLLTPRGNPLRLVRAR